MIILNKQSIVTEQFANREIKVKDFDNPCSAGGKFHSPGQILNEMGLARFIY
ncbi:hypothetical protein [Sphingobacterium deserti]|uniref:hypothetical protein n=1 Tax=Sphingobacterium deserti TaxID=1229276 RepID=UPI000A70C618|nr:hypothetical protein [Sphingobacterium deserti]